MPKPVTSHGHAQKRPNQIPFLYLVRAGIAASPSGHNQTIKTTTDIFTQMQHKYHPHLPEDYECFVPVQIPSMKSLGARVQLKIHPRPRKDQQSPVLFCFEKTWSLLHHSWWQTGTASEQARSPVHWVCWENQLDPNAQRESIHSIFLKSSSWLVGTVRKLHLGIYIYIILL